MFICCFECFVFFMLCVFCVFLVMLLLMFLVMLFGMYWCVVSLRILCDVRLSILFGLVEIIRKGFCFFFELILSEGVVEIKIFNFFWCFFSFDCNI